MQINRSYPSGSWETLIDTLSGLSYTWPVVGPVTSTARVRVFLNSIPSVGDTSEGNFTIVNPTITLIQPTGNHTWLVNTQQEILWQKFGTTDNIRIELDRNYPSGNWELIAAAAPSYYYTWLINGPPTLHARVRLTLVSNSSIGDTCETDFSINQPTLTIQSPVGNDTLLVGYSTTIRWSRYYTTGNVRVDLNRNYPSGTWETLAASTSLDTLSWTATGPASTNCRFRVVFLTDTTVRDISDANSSVLVPAITLVTPAFGDTILLGSNVNFTWTKSAVTHSVNLAIKRAWPSGLWETIGSNLTGNSYSWTAVGASNEARFRVISTVYSSIGDTTDGAVPIGQPQISISVPSQTQTYRVVNKLISC